MQKLPEAIFSMVIIGGIQKTSLVDYPENIATTVFLQGCNFKCGFCHNPGLVEKGKESISEEEFFSFIDSRKGLIDGVCISGGEPTMQKDLVDFVRKIKEKGFLVKVDTNGSNPEMVKELIDVVDFIAMDVKVVWKNYNKLGGDAEKVKKSVEVLKNNKVDYEFRLTLHPSFQSKEEVFEIAKNLKNGKKLVLQQFQGKEKILDSRFKDIRPYSENEIKEMQKECDKFLKTKVRI